MMKKVMFLLVLMLPLVSQAGDYESTLLVQTGQLRESDLIVRTVSDLESNKICLAFYVRTIGTSPVMNCYDAISGFYSKIRQVGHFKEGKLVVRKLKDTVNDVSCLVAYVSVEGTSPAIDCYKSSKPTKDTILREEHLSEGDLPDLLHDQGRRKGRHGAEELPARGRPHCPEDRRRHQQQGVSDLLCEHAGYLALYLLFRSIRTSRCVSTRVTFAEDPGTGLLPPRRLQTLHAGQVSHTS
jgi:hypothetical protein